LEENGIDYMLTGSFARNMHGVPRTTYDVDIVIEVEPVALEELVRSLGDGFYVSAEAAREAVSRRSMFNVIHSQIQLMWATLEPIFALSHHLFLLNHRRAGGRVVAILSSTCN